jgi:hypothetical protein
MNVQLEIWNASWLLIHAVALIGVVALFPKAPCWMQQIVLAGVAVAESLFIVGLYGEARSFWWGAWFINGGYAFEHLAVLFWLFRLTFFPNGAQWTSSSRASRSS